MTDDPATMKQLADLKKQIEKIVGKAIDAEPSQLINLAHPVGSSYYEEGSQVTWYRTILPGQVLRKSGHAARRERSLRDRTRRNARLSPERVHLQLSQLVF